MKLIFLIMLAYTISIFPQDYKEVKIFINSNTDLQKAYSLAVDFEHIITDKDGGYILFVNEEEFKSITKSGLSYEVLIDDWLAYYKSLPELSKTEKDFVKLESESAFGVTGFDYGTMGGYYTLAEIEADLDEMHQLFPNLITQKFSIGTSHEGRTIWAARISDNPAINEDEPKVGFDALVHAREPQSMATQMYYMWYLLENYGTDPEATYLVENREMYFVPCFNPDGYEYNRQTNPGGGGFWRKNRRNNGGSYGVDLNRNFGYMWGYDDIGSSPNPSSETYRGPSAFSEPEAQAIRDLANQKSYKTHFNMHTHGGYILYPWGYIDAETPDSLTYREFAALLTSYSGYAYGSGSQLLGYPSNGSIRDWMYGEQTTKNKTFGYTIEIGNAFWPSQSQIYPIAQQNLRTMIYQSFLAGEYVQLSNPNFNKEYFLPGDIIELTPEIKNIGLATAHNLTFELTSPTQHVTIIAGNAALDSLEARSSAVIQQLLQFEISNAVPVETTIPIVITTRTNNNITASDTLNIIIGFPVFIFEDNSNNPNAYWTITKTPTTSPQWDSTYKTFYSEPNSYTDSKNGNYVNNATVTMTLTSPIDLSGYANPKLSYWTKLSIENDFDYGQVKVSTNNGTTWIPLAGNYTQPGVSPQPIGQPVYDGSISNWVKEEISLTNYVSSQVKLQYQLKTDGGVTRDGWYLDDIGIYFYTIPTDASEQNEPVYKFFLEQNYPNPFNPTTKIKYTIPSNVNGQMSFVKIIIYDVLGNEVATLVNEEKSAGNYEAEFDAASFSSGIYFYELRAGIFNETKKMILMK